MQEDEDRASPRGDRKSESAERSGAPRSRSSGGPPPNGPSPRAQDDSRRRRSSDRRYAGYGDGIDRFYCERDLHRLPSSFPVEARTGAATVPATVVARRAGALLLCSFSHAGAHQWPGGEETVEAGAIAEAPESGESG